MSAEICIEAGRDAFCAAVVLCCNEVNKQVLCVLKQLFLRSVYEKRVRLDEFSRCHSAMAAKSGLRPQAMCPIYLLSGTGAPVPRQWHSPAAQLGDLLMASFCESEYREGRFGLSQYALLLISKGHSKPGASMPVKLNNLAVGTIQ